MLLATTTNHPPTHILPNYSGTLRYVELGRSQGREVNPLGHHDLDFLIRVGLCNWEDANSVVREEGRSRPQLRNGVFDGARRRFESYPVGCEFLDGVVQRALTRGIDWSTLCCGFSLHHLH
jgi:hypothetical protein